MRKLCVCLLLVIPLSCTAIMSSAYGETRVYQELTDKQKMNWLLCKGHYGKEKTADQ
ncbi:hypothetical protein AAGG52_05280 [Bacillus licheniformis]